eukprot:gene40418-54665_t
MSGFGRCGPLALGCGGPINTRPYAEMEEERMLEGRDWFRVNGATTEDLARLRAAVPDEMPTQYLDLLTFSNGGEGPLAINPYNFCLDPALTVVEAIESGNHGQADLHGFLIFGNNGGG